MTDRHVIGTSPPRVEDRRFLIGAGRFADDIVVPGAVHAHFVRSPYAHARLRGIDADAARALPGVLGVWTGAELNAATRRLRMAPPIEGLKPTEVTALPEDRLRFVGDPYAIVLAVDRYVAEDAAELVRAEFEPLAAVADFAAALATGAPLVDEALATNLVSQQRFATPDLERRFAGARVVAARFSQHRQTHAPIETRGCIAQWDEGRRHLTFISGNQAPHPLRTALATRLALSESQVTVVSPDIGGGFGQKIALWREELCIAALARLARRPVRWREDRLENLTAACHAREETAVTRTAVAADGRILALDLAIDADFGAYCFFPANYMARVVGMILTGPYRIRDYGYSVRAALTNKCPAAPMRAPMAIASWIMDGTIDAIARELGLDPVSVRRANALGPADLPWTMPSGEVLHDVTPRETLERALPRGAVHQGIAVQTAPLEPLDLDDLIRRLDGRARARVLVLDQVTDPHNVGAILRSAAAFGADAVILPERHAPAASATMAKAASGAMETVDLVRVVNLARALDALKEAQIWCVGLTGDAAQSLDSADLTGRVALVLGSEGDGLRRLTRERCDLLVRIPMAPNAVGSLNVSNAAAIALYAASRGGSETG